MSDVGVSLNTPCGALWERILTVLNPTSAPFPPKEKTTHPLARSPAPPFPARSGSFTSQSFQAAGGAVSPGGPPSRTPPRFLFPLFLSQTGGPAGF